MTTTTKLQPPAPLDITKLHSPAEVLRHKAEQAAYFESVRAEEQRQRMKEQAEKAYANRVLTPDEYFAEALKRQAEQQARDDQREFERQAERDAKAAYLESTPDIAEVSERSEFSFLQGVIHWASKGYTLTGDGITAFLPGFYCCRLNKPATIKKAK